MIFCFSDRLAVSFSVWPFPSYPPARREAYDGLQWVPFRELFDLSAIQRCYGRTVELEQVIKAGKKPPRLTPQPWGKRNKVFGGWNSKKGLGNLESEVGDMFVEGLDDQWSTLWCFFVFFSSDGWGWSDVGEGQTSSLWKLPCSSDGLKWLKECWNVM